MKNALHLALALVPMFVGGATAQTPSTEEKIQKLVETLKSGKVKPAERANAVKEGLEGVDLSKLTSRQIETLTDVGFSQLLTPEMRTPVNERLVALASERNVDGAVAAMMRPNYVAPPPGKMTEELYKKLQADRRELVIEAVKHPSLADAIKAGRGAGFLSAAAMAKGPDAAKAGVFKTLAPMITDALPASSVQSVIGLTDACAEPDSGVDDAASEKLRVTTLALVDKAIADPKTDERTKKYFTDTVKKQLMGASARRALLNHAAPPTKFTWSNVKPELKSFADLKGKVVVVDFWATWCGPCVKAFPHVKEMQERYKDSPVAILGVTSLQGYIIDHKATDPKQRRIDTKDPKDELARMPGWIKDMDVTWTIAFSEESCFNADFGVNGIPHIALIDAKGVVRYNGIHPSDKTLEDKIDELVKEAGGKVPARAEKKPEKTEGENH